jgi:hypothetical protein
MLDVILGVMNVIGVLVTLRWIGIPFLGVLHRAFLVHVYPKWLDRIKESIHIEHVLAITDQVGVADVLLNHYILHQHVLLKSLAQLLGQAVPHALNYVPLITELIV